MKSHIMITNCYMLKLFLRFHKTHFYLIYAVLHTLIAAILNNALFLHSSLSPISVQHMMISGNIFGHNDSNWFS